jgi:hypothetical protein
MDRAYAPRRLLIAILAPAILIGVLLAGAFALSSRDDAGRTTTSSPSVASREGRLAPLEEALDRLERTIRP